MEKREKDVGSPTVDPPGGWSRGSIRSQLHRILTHREFQATEKMRDFLRFIVEETLAGRADQLKGYTIATGVFGRGDDFDPAQDPVVRIQAGRLRRALERYYLVAGQNDTIRIDMPKGGYVPRFLHPNPTVQEDGPGDSSAPTFLTRPSVAVLPLDNLTGDPEQQVFTMGLAEELVTELNRFQDLLVVPCYWAPASSGPPPDRKWASRLCNARFLLGGSLRRDTRRVKVSMHLIDMQVGHQVWAESYEPELEASRLIGAQEEIARSVVALLASEYGIIAQTLSTEARKRPPAELDTYEAMLRYYTYQIRPSPASSEICFAALQRAVEREPEYGPAWSALATLHCHKWTFDVPGCGDALDTALRHARRGMSLEPNSQIGHLILAYASYLAEEYDDFHREAKTALALNPNSPYAVGTVGHFYVLTGEFSRGMALLDEAIRANPLHPHWFHQGYYVDAFRRREYDCALLEMEQYELTQGYWVDVLYAAALGKLGRTTEAAPHVEAIVQGKPDFAPRARELFRRSLKVESLIDDLIDGVRRAGLEVP